MTLTGPSSKDDASASEAGAVLIDDREEEDAVALPPTKRPKTGPSPCSGGALPEVIHRISLCFNATLVSMMFSIPHLFLKRFCDDSFGLLPKVDAATPAGSKALLQAAAVALLKKPLRPIAGELFMQTEGRSVWPGR
mmetsp:Transcript_63090/g.138203  ORF Transcript_63090/g.138203 Transcript_63090/m.138203 type:complete len:137 (-) Transcript_63090:74-484(-)